MEFEFDPETHLYRMGGRIIPSVTQILKEAGILKFGANGSELKNDFAMSRGTAVHAACHYLDEGNLNWSTVQDEIVPYVMAYEQFKKETGFKPRRMEESLVNVPMAFAGTIDREGEWNLSKHPLVLEIKTGAWARWWGLQLAGYECLLPKLARQRERHAVQLKPDGTYQLHEFKDPGDIHIFQSLVAIFWWKANAGL